MSLHGRGAEAADRVGDNGERRHHGDALAHGARAVVGDVEKRYVPGTLDYHAARAHVPDLTAGKSVPVYNDWN